MPRWNARRCLKIVLLSLLQSTVQTSGIQIEDGASASHSIAALIDSALSAVAGLSAHQSLTPQEEVDAVQRILAADAPTLLLARHFAASPHFEAHLKGFLARSAQLLSEAVPTGTGAAATGEGQCSDAAEGARGVGMHAVSAADALRMRRSVVKYDTTRAVPEDVLRRALEAAVLAPNHFLTEPWRFYVAGEATRAALVAMNPKKHEMFSAVPGWLIVTMAHSDPDAQSYQCSTKGREDYAATACAVQNLMLSLSAEGVGSKWMTGALGVAPERVLEVVGADAQKEIFVGAIWYGYPAQPLSPVNPAPERKRGLAGVLTTLP